MKYVNTLTQEYLKSILHYNPETELFTWLVPTGRRVKVGMPAGTDKNIYPYRGKFAIRVCLGTYDTKEEAILMRDKFLKEFKFEDEFLHSSLKDRL